MSAQEKVPERIRKKKKSLSTLLRSGGDPRVRLSSALCGDSVTFIKCDTPACGKRCEKKQRFALCEVNGSRRQSGGRAPSMCSVGRGVDGFGRLPFVMLCDSIRCELVKNKTITVHACRRWMKRKKNIL